MTGLRLHARTMHVQAATGKLSMELIRLQEELDLTNTEMLQALLQEAGRIGTRLLRAERHPDDPDRKADEE